MGNVFDVVKLVSLCKCMRDNDERTGCEMDLPISMEIK